MSTPQVNVAINFAGQEQFSAAEGIAGGNAGQRTLYTGSKALEALLNATSTPKVDKSPLVTEITLGAGITTIDLTAAPGLVLPFGTTRNIDFTGAKLVAFLFEGTGVGAVNVAPGASNPYALFGTGNDIDVSLGQIVCGVFRGVATTLPAVSGSVKTIDLSGGSGRKLYLELYFGT